VADFQREPPVKLYYRIGEVSEIVGVEPHVLRYWETEFRSIRPQKSRKGQRIYSRRDVDKLLTVKDLLYTHGFTIAGARKRLREGGVEPQPAPQQKPKSELFNKLSALRSDVASMLAELETDAERERGVTAG
jgi:DNA-binding transcriptional MerR regulator